MAKPDCQNVTDSRSCVLEAKPTQMAHQRESHVTDCITGSYSDIAVRDAVGTSFVGVVSDSVRSRQLKAVKGR